MPGDHEDSIPVAGRDMELSSADFDEEASTEWNPEAFEMDEGLGQKPAEDLVTQMGKTRTRMHEAGAIGRRRPAVLKIANTARSGGFDFRGPELSEILSEYTPAPEEGAEDEFSLDFDELVATFLRMYTDLKTSFCISDERWVEIREYLAAELARYINSGKLANGNMGLKPRAFLRREVPALIQAQINASKEQPAFGAEVALKTVRTLNPDLKTAFDQIICYPLNILIQEAYQAEIKACQKTATWWETVTRKDWRKEIDRPYGGAGGFGEDFAERLQEALERDLAAFVLDPTRTPWRRLKEMSPSLKIHCEKEKDALANRANDHSTNHPNYATVRADQIAAIEARFKEELTGVLKRQAVEMFGGELVVVAQVPGQLKYPLQTKPFLANHPHSAQIFCAEPHKIKSF